MTPIRAFVGHSFTKDDEALNSTFLGYLDQIKSMGIGFTWDHAKAAEPRELSEKVMDLIRDKNLFFGICTKKERVIEPEELKRCWITRKVLRADEGKIHWKTSDWIIQEIGMAVGREMSLILLIEEGIRLPGGLQGNIEYIGFNRQSPESSFVKILEMIQALMPKISKTLVQEISTTSAESSSQEQEPDERDTSWREPKPEWTFEDYKLALFRSIFLKEPQTEKKINASFLESQDGQEPQYRAAWKAMHEYLLLFYGMGGKLVQIETLARENPDVSEVHNYLGLAYDRYKEFSKSAAAYYFAANKAELLPDKHSLLGKSAIAYRKAEMRPKSDEIITIMKQDLLISPELEENLIVTLKKIAEMDSEMDAFYGLSEKLLELKPDDNETRFELAFKYSNDNKGNLSLFQYLRIPIEDRGNMAWNNLGAQYDDFEIPGLSVACYRKSEENGETLAMANIANKYIKAGFLAEAEEICRKALQIRDCHQNVNYFMTRIKAIPEEEDNKGKNILKEAARLSNFYREYGRALCKPNLSDCTGEWDGPKCCLKIMIQGQNFNAEGTYEIKKGLGLAAAAAFLYSPSAPREPAKPEKYIIKYAGRVSGYAVKGVVEDKEVIDLAMPRTLLGGLGKSDRTVLLVISHSLDEIQVLDLNEPEEKRFYVLRKLKRS